VSKMRHVRIKLPEANAFVLEHHRHHKPVIGHLFSIGAVLDDKLVGVAIVGRPVARMRDDGITAEVTRLCTDGTRNACSFLYGASARAAFALGFQRIGTYILASETRRDSQRCRLAANRRNKRWIMVKAVKRKNRQAPDTAKDAVREHPYDIVSSRPGYVTLRAGFEVSGGDYMMAYAPLSVVRKICEPV